MESTKFLLHAFSCVRVDEVWESNASHLPTKSKNLLRASIVPCVPMESENLMHYHAFVSMESENPMHHRAFVSMESENLMHFLAFVPMESRESIACLRACAWMMESKNLARPRACGRNLRIENLVGSTLCWHGLPLNMYVLGVFLYFLFYF